MSRTPMSKRLRFDVLERDGFACRYCGAKPEDGALHVDHIISVADGGETVIDNLITACEPCNTGKGSRRLSAAQPLPDMTTLADEAKRITAEINKWRKAHKKRDETTGAAAQQIRADHDVSVPIRVLERAIREFGIAEVDHAADITGERVDRNNPKGQTAYLFAVMRHRREDEDDPAPMPQMVKPAPVIADKKCPWGERCPSDLATCIEYDDQYNPISGCAFAINAIGGWERHDAEDVLSTVSDYVDLWRDGQGIQWFVKHLRSIDMLIAAMRSGALR